MQYMFATWKTRKQLNNFKASKNMMKHALTYKVTNLLGKMVKQTLARVCAVV